MRWFCDFHHSALAHSIRLMSKRIGAEVYFPIGMEYADLGYWLVHKPYNFNQATAMQYLSLDQRYIPMDGTAPLNRTTAQRPTHFELADLAHGDILKSITLDQFKSIDIDVVIASIPDHVKSFTRLIKEHKPKAKLVLQIGNIAWNGPVQEMIRKGKVKNLLASVKKFDLPASINAVFYHQEMRLKDFVEPPTSLKIKSFVHLLPQPEVYNRYKEALPEVTFRAYGASCPDGFINNVEKLFYEMRDCSIGFMNKPNGDGFGHVFHSFFMLGRPIITNFKDYEDKLGGLLLEDQVTAIDLSRRSFEENVSLIRSILNDRSRLIEMCKNAFNKFREVVDYEREGVEIAKFFQNLL